MPSSATCTNVERYVNQTHEWIWKISGQKQHDGSHSSHELKSWGEDKKSRMPPRFLSWSPPPSFISWWRNNKKVLDLIRRKKSKLPNTFHLGSAAAPVEILPHAFDSAEICNHGWIRASRLTLDISSEFSRSLSSIESKERLNSGNQVTILQCFWIVNTPTYQLSPIILV